LGKADSFKMLAGNSGAGDKGKPAPPPPGCKAASSFNQDYTVTMEIRQSARNNAYPPTSLIHEEEGGGWRKSEVPIVAMKSGNADGAKGCRFEITDKGNMTRH
jgi:hypothetical protein